MKKACNLCKKFIGFGVHWAAGKCPKYDEISMFDYVTTAEKCDCYETDFINCCYDCMSLDCSLRNDFMTNCSCKIPIPDKIPIFDNEGNMVAYD